MRAILDEMPPIEIRRSTRDGWYISFVPEAAPFQDFSDPRPIGIQKIDGTTEYLEMIFVSTRNCKDFFAAVRARWGKEYVEGLSEWYDCPE
jgi:hypothetical protein